MFRENGARFQKTEFFSDNFVDSSGENPETPERPKLQEYFENLTSGALDFIRKNPEKVKTLPRFVPVSLQKALRVFGLALTLTPEVAAITFPTSSPAENDSTSVKKELKLKQLDNQPGDFRLYRESSYHQGRGEGITMEYEKKMGKNRTPVEFTGHGAFVGGAMVVEGGIDVPVYDKKAFQIHSINEIDFNSKEGTAWFVGAEAGINLKKLQMPNASFSITSGAYLDITRSKDKDNRSGSKYGVEAQLKGNIIPRYISEDLGIKVPDFYVKVGMAGRERGMVAIGIQTHMKKFWSRKK